MAGNFNIIKDSSIWVSSKNRSAVNRMDGLLRIGVVESTFNDAKTGELRYLVAVQNNTYKVTVNCRMLRRFGGAYNYEDFILRGYTTTDKPDPVNAFDAKAGDAVLVGQLNGQGREGVILGGLNHAARTTSIVATGGPQYQSEFNGIKTDINSDGEWTLTFRGQPTNLAALKDVPSNKLASPKYDASIGTSYMKFDKTGSWTVADNATSNPQLIKIDKAAGTITFTSGSVSLKLAKADQSVLLTSQKLTVNSTNSITETTQDYSMSASKTAKMKSPKVAIGTDSIELIDQLTQLIKALGTITPISPIGPCTALQATPTWAQVEAIKSKLNQIKGSF